MYILHPEGSLLTNLAARLEQARSFSQQGQRAEAAAICQEILEQLPTHLDSLILSAEISASNGNSALAIEFYEKVIEHHPSYAQAYYKRGNLLKDNDQLEAALSSYDHAIALNPGYAHAYCNRGVVLARLNRLDTALDSYDQAIALNAGDALAYYNRGSVLRELNRPEDALASYNLAIAIKRDYAECHCNRGNLQSELGQWDAALVSYDDAIAINPHFYQAFCNRGTLQRNRKQWDAALASYDRAIEINPDYAEAHCYRGVLLTELRKWEGALASVNRAIALRPDFAEAYCCRGNLLAELNQDAAALANYDKAISINPDYTDAFSSRGNTLVHMKRFESAIESYDRAIVLDIGCKYALGMRQHAKMNVCDWSEWEFDVRRLAAGIDAGETVSPPFPNLALVDCPALHLKAAQIWVREESPANPILSAIPKHIRRDRIRIGYFSADFHDHPVAVLMAELFETHDRSEFDVTAFSFGPNTQDHVRKRLEKAFERFIDARGKSDQEISMLARSLDIDIAIDLGGHTSNSRTRIFAMRAAPIQVNYLGYPGTMGANYMDYLIAHPTIIPAEYQRHYIEKIVYLPHSYLPYDSARRIANTVVTRDELGLPGSGFVFSCFNNNYKITPTIFDSWMRILSRAENSVLWLSQNNPTAADNLRKEALRRGVDASRLIFANRVSAMPEHLARHRVADLFLDTGPYNAHATAMDALWAGLPVLTCVGESFACRVAASLLSAIDLPELIASTSGEYEHLAVALAGNPARMGQIREKLARNRLVEPLFNGPLFAKHLESAYSEIYERYQSNLPPEHIYAQS